MSFANSLPQERPAMVSQNLTSDTNDWTTITESVSEAQTEDIDPHTGTNESYGLTTSWESLNIDFQTNLSTLAENIFYWSLIFFASFGSLNNLLTILVCLRKAIRTHSWGIYLMALAVADLMNLVSYAVCFNTFHRSCMFVISYVQGLGHWMILVIAVDRMLVIFYPFKAGVYSTRKRALIVSSFFYFLVFCYNLPLLIGITGGSICKFCSIHHMMNFWMNIGSSKMCRSVDYLYFKWKIHIRSSHF